MVEGPAYKGISYCPQGKRKYIQAVSLLKISLRHFHQHRLKTAQLILLISKISPKCIGKYNVHETKVIKIIKMSMLVVPDSVTPWIEAHQTLLSMGFSRQEYWSGLPLPSPGDLPHPGIEPRTPALQIDSLPTEL